MSHRHGPESQLLKNREILKCARVRTGGHQPTCQSVQDLILLTAENKNVTKCWQQVFKMAAFALDAQPGPFQRTYRNFGGGGGGADHRDGACSYSER